MNVALECREVNGPNRDGVVNSAKGQLTPEDIWKEPADRLLERTRNDPCRPRRCKSPVAADDLRTQRRRDRQTFAALAAIPQPFQQPAGHHPARGERVVRCDR